MQNVEEKHSKWQIIVPMMHLNISDDPPINGKWTVGEVAFYSKEALRPLTESFLSKSNCRDFLETQIFESNSFAVIEREGKPTDIHKRVFFNIKQAVNILASTAAFYTNRTHACGFTIKGFPFLTQKHDTFLEIEGTLFCGNWGNNGILMPFALDENWHTNICSNGAVELFDRIVDPALQDAWRRQIGSGAAMLGRSLMSLDLADAFLLNVIGLETLLTNKGERNGKILFQRIKGMTGWHLKVARPNYETEIKSIHSVRCEIVHDSDYSNLTTELLLLSDMYLANSLFNIIRRPLMFPDKASLTAKLDGFAANEDRPTDDENTFQWIGNSQFSRKELDIDIW